MLLNCGVGEDSWESLGLQGDPTSQILNSTLNTHWKNWCWNWNSNILATWCKDLLIRKDPDAGKDWRQEEKWTTEDEMVRWHHWLHGHEFEQTLGDGEGQGRWRTRCVAVHGVTKSQTQLSYWATQWNEPWFEAERLPKATLSMWCSGLSTSSLIPIPWLPPCSLWPGHTRHPRPRADPKSCSISPDSVWA